MINFWWSCITWYCRAILHFASPYTDMQWAASFPHYIPLLLQPGWKSVCVIILCCTDVQFVVIQECGASSIHICPWGNSIIVGSSVTCSIYFCASQKWMQGCFQTIIVPLLLLQIIFLLADTPWNYFLENQKVILQIFWEIECTVTSGIGVYAHILTVYCWVEASHDQTVVFLLWTTCTILYSIACYTCITFLQGYMVWDTPELTNGVPSFTNGKNICY